MKSTQNGFTLIELMIGMLVGLIAVAATISAFTSIVRSNTDYLKMVRLNQELNSVMTLITRDLKRAGFSDAATGVTSVNSFMDPYPATVSGNNIYIGSASIYGGASANDCITFTYDIVDATSSNVNGTVDSSGTNKIDEHFGYRRDSGDGSLGTIGAVEARRSGRQCDQNNWEAITDNDIINISNLTFTDNVLSVTTAGLGEIRYIGITLTGSLVKDPAVTRTLTERVRVRNDRP